MRNACEMKSDKELERQRTLSDTGTSGKRPDGASTGGGISWRHAL